MNSVDLTDKQRVYVDGLRALADFIEARPDLCPTYSTVQINIFADGEGDELRADFARLVRLVGRGEKCATDTWFNFVRKFGPHELHITARRVDVCERVVVGVDEVEVPDPEAVAALPKVVQQVERVEWVCPDSVLRFAAEVA